MSLRSILAVIVFLVVFLVLMFLAGESSENESIGSFVVAAFIAMFAYFKILKPKAKPSASEQTE